MGWFSPDQVTDATFGSLQRKRGSWVGTYEFDGLGRVALAIAGDRRAPDAASLALAKSVPAQYSALRSTIARALFQHLEPYAEATRDGELDVAGFDPSIVGSADDTWAHVRVKLVDVDAGRREFPVEIQINVAWDEEHTLGVRIADGALRELNGSVLPGPA